jgi:hypothetical protein
LASDRLLPAGLRHQVPAGVETVHGTLPRCRHPAAHARPGMKGDRVEIVVDAGGVTKTYDVVATRAGRRVEVIELTRSGTAVRTARFMATRVIALVEHPATAARPVARPGREHPREPGG